MLKIRRPLGRLIFNMGIAIPGKTVFLIETAPSNMEGASISWCHHDLSHILLVTHNKFPTMSEGKVWGDFC